MTDDIKNTTHFDQIMKDTFDDMLEGAQIIGFDWKYIYINNMAAAHNRRSKEELIGKKYTDMWPGIEDTEVYRIIKLSMEKRVIRSLENEFIFPNGSVGWFELKIQPVPEGVFILSVDITERKKAEADLIHLNKVYAVLSNINQVIVRIKDKKQMLDEACRIIVEDGKTRFAWVGFIDELTHSIYPFSKFGYEKGYLDNLDTFVDLVSGTSPLAVCIRENRLQCLNIQELDQSVPWKKAALEREYRSALVFPLNAGGKVIGAITIYSSEADYFNENEIKLLKELASDISFSLETLQTEEQKRKTDIKLKESEERYRGLFEHMAEGYAYCRMLYENGVPYDWIYIDVNEMFEKLTGLKDVTGKNVSEVITDIKTSDPKLFEIYSRVALTGIHEKFEVYVEALKMWFSISVYSPEKGYFVAVFDVINDRKLAEEQIKQSENRLRSFYESGLVGVVYWNKDGSISHANDKYLNMLGYTRQELTEGKVNWIASTPPEFKHIDDECIAELMEFGVNRKRYEKEYARKDGSRVPVMLAGAMLDDERLNGVAYVLDITERKQAENLLKESELKFLTAFNSSPVAMAISSVEDRKYVIVNDVFLRDSGYSRDEVIGKTTEELQFFINDDERENLLKEAIKNGYVYGMEVKCRMKHGNILTCLIYTTLIKISGKPHLISSIADITDRIQAEEKITVSETRYRRLFESAKDGILILDADTGMIVDVNPFLIEMLGYPLEAFLKKTIWDIGFFKDIASNEEKFWELQQNEYIRYEDVPLETFDGRKMNVEFVSNVYMVDHTKVIQCNIRNITERKLIEKSLVESEGRFRKIFEQASMGIVLTARDLKFLSANTEFCNMLGYTEEELKSKTLLDVTHPDNRNADRENVEKMWEGKIPHYRTLKSYVTKNGDIRWGSLSTTILAGADGKPLYALGMVEDITERKRAEEALYESEKKLSNAMTIAMLGHWEYDVVKDLFTFNDHFYSIFRTSVDEVGGYTMPASEYAERFVHPDDIALVGIEIQKAIETNDPNFTGNIEHRIIYADGETGYISVRFFIIKDEKGRTIKTVGANQDITERKKAEEELHEQHILMQSLINNSPDLIYIKDDKSRFRMASNSVAEYMGTKPENLIGKTDSDFYPGELAEKFNSDEREIIESGKALINSEEPRINKDGSKTWILTTKVPLYNTVGKISGILGISRDITKLKIDELRIQHLNMVYSVLSNVNEAIVRIADKKKLLDEICRVIVEEGKTAFVWVGFVDNITKRIIPYSKYGYDKGYLDKIDISIMDIPSGRGPIGACIRKDKYAFINDVRNDPRMEPWKNAALERGYNSVCAFPIKIKGKAIGAIAIYAYETDFFNEDEIKLMVELAGDVSFALETMELNESRKIAEQKILEDELILKALVNNIPESVLLTDVDGVIVYANETVAKRFGTTQEKIVGINTYNLVEKDVGEMRRMKVNEALVTGKQVTFQDKRNDRYVDNYINPVFNKEGCVSGVAILGIDRTESIKTEEEIKKSEQLLRFHVENTPLGVVEWDTDFRVKRWNHSAERIFGYTESEAIGKHSSFIVAPESNEQVGDSWEGLLNNKGGFRSTNSNLNKDGDIIICSWYNTPLLDKDGKVMRVLSLVDDITDKVKAENELKVSLDERELLLKEIHHRVKNNLQVVASLLKIQSEHVKDEASKGYFKISADRVRAMALIHQQLYGSSNLSRINFEYYLRNLASHLYNLYCQKPEGIKMNLKARGVTMSIDNAVPCGLLVNEILTNSLKHAFPENRKGEININLEMTGDQYVLEIRDNGVGMPENVNFEEETTLGVQLIRMLVEQLDATMEISRSKGTSFKIKFSAFTYKKRV